MPTRKRYSFWIDESQAEALKAVKARDGVLESEQIRRAIDDWLKKRRPMAGRGRAPGRRRSGG